MRKILFNLLLILGVCAFNAQAQQLYKWVDEHGITHYGDALPANYIEHESFQFVDYGEQASAESNYYSIQNQLQRLQDRRAEQIKQRKQLADIQATKNPPVNEVYVASQPVERSYYAPAYFPYGLNKGWQRPYLVPDYKRRHQPKHLPQQAMDKPRSGIVSNMKKSSSAVISAAK